MSVLIDGIALFGNFFLWGIKPLLEKSVIRKTNSLDMSLLRYVVGGVLAIAMILVLGRWSNFMRFGLGVYGWMFMIAFAAYFALFLNYYLLSKYDANLVFAIVNPLTVITTMILGAFYFGERVTWKRVVGVLITCIGIVVIYGTKDD